MEFGGVKRVAVVGAGVAGLTAAKTLLARGLECTVFERASVLGGVWASGYLNFGVQVQRELYEFPDWPLPSDTPNFTPGPIVQRYLEDYARHFGVWPHLRFDTTVQALDERDDGGAGWQLTYERDGVSEAARFDLVVVCIGLYSQKPHLPETPQRDDFGGDIIHASTLKSLDQLRGKRVNLYRQMLHPDVANLVFIGNASTVLSILTYSLQARWLSELIGGSHMLPTEQATREDIARMRAWKRRCMPFSQARGARLILHMQHYHDDLLADLGQTPLRKTGVAAPFKEVFAPYEPRDYRDVVAGAE